MANFYLAMESATTVCSVALFEGEKLIDLIEEGGSYSHAEKLAPFVDLILKKNDLNIRQLAAIAISAGPGSYTGLRIGLSLAKGLCFAAELPLIAIPTHLGIAAGATEAIGNKEALYTTMIDARRMEVYSMTYDHKMNIVQSLEAEIIDDLSYAEQLKKSKVYFIGDGAAKCADALKDENAFFPESSFISAAHWGKLLVKKYSQEEFEDLAYFEPNYLKNFKAGKPKPLV